MPPPALSDATSGTILYEDVVYDWQGQHQALYDRVELFKEKNGMDESVKYTDDEFRKVFLALDYSRRYGTVFSSLWSAPNEHNLYADFSATYSFHH